ncbi:MAG TPA: (2Fe-2S)-binding protein [Desulfobulbaceae bacterium]|nr:(2Fe-2S)-binding protein [Desulfobulbaceae bacterium]
MQPDERTIARLKPGCICMGIRLHRILEAIDQGAASFDEIARMTGIGRGDCQGRRCGQKVAQLLADRANRRVISGPDSSS